MSRRGRISASRRRRLRTCEPLEPRLALSVVEVYVTELSAANNTTLADADGEYGDWIELYNADAEPLDLSGWRLADGPNAAGAWTFPAGTTIAAGAFLVVFASGKDRAVTGQELHTDFALDADGETVVLFDGQGAIACALPFPEQHTAASYGVLFTAGQPEFDERRFFLTSSPGSMNGAGVLGFAAEPFYSQPHGFYEAAEAFALGIHSLTPNATIYYTTDGSTPTPGGAATMVYDAGSPPLVNRTTTVRAMSRLDGYVDSSVATSTYIFLDDVLTQSPTGQAPTGWPAAGNGPNGQRLDYGMDPNVVNDPVWGPQLKAALTAIPSFSIVTDLGNLFDPTSGIYVNAQQHGDAWERPTSVELIYPDGQSGPDGQDGFQIDAGLRIRGGFSRTPGNPKHAFRLFFRDEYGDAKLVYPLFGDEGASTFDNIDLRTDQNDSWAYQRSRELTAIHDIFSRETQAAMGQPYTRSEFYHLYVNGMYWGLYQTQERPEASYGETYFGGDKDDYDVIKSTGSPLYQTEATDGTIDAWQTMWQLARSVPSDPNAYYRLQGLNPDGTRNPAYPVLLDVDNLIDYMIVIFYTGDEDASLSVPFGNNRSNNWYAMRNRVGEEGFRFFIHDAEQTLFSNHNISDLSADRTGPFLDPNQNLLQYSNPQWVHQDLMAHEEYRLRFADHVEKHLSPGGALSQEAILARWNELAAQAQLPIIGESARWGDAQREPPFTQTDWAYAVQNVAERFFPAREHIFLEQLKTDQRENPALPGNLIPGALYPSVAAPRFSQPGGRVDAGTTIALASPPDETHTDTTLLPTTAAKRAFVPTNDSLGTSWTQPTFNDAAWLSGTSGVGYELQPAHADSVSSLIGTNVSSMYSNSSSVFVRTEFTIAAGQQFDELWLRMKYNDGFIAYIDGVEVVRSGNTPRGNPVADFAGFRDNKLAKQWEEHDISPALASLTPGTHTLAIHGYNDSRFSVRMLVLPELIGREVATSTAQSTVHFTTDGSDPRLSGGAISPTAMAYAGAIPVNAAMTVNARALVDGQWSALASASFSVPSMLRISELMYHPTPQTPAELARSPDGTTAYDKDEYEYIELFNAGAAAVSLAGMRIDGGVRMTLGDATLAAGEYAVVVRNADAFVNRYGTGPRIVGQYGGLPDDDRLSNAGEQLTLVDAAGFAVLDFTYDDAPPWPTSPDGMGYSLVIANRLADPATWANAAAWRASYEPGGSPGEVDTIAGDLDADGRVGLRDLILLQNHLGIASGALRSTGDLNGDGAVTVADVGLFAARYGQTAADGPAPSSPVSSPAASVVAQRQSGDTAAAVRRTASVRRSLHRAAVDTALAAIPDDRLGVSSGGEWTDAESPAVRRRLRR